VSTLTLTGRHWQVRFKNRYLLVEFIFPSSLPTPTTPTTIDNDDDDDHPSILPPPPELNEAALVNILRESLAVNFGQVGWAEAGGSLQGTKINTHTLAH
jgi:ribonuclease P/MRP protein subunit POP5